LKWIFTPLMAYLTYGMSAKAVAIRFGVHLPSLGE
jgi:transposase